MPGQSHQSRRRRSHSPSAVPSILSRHHYRCRSPATPHSKARDARVIPATSVILPFQAPPLRKGDFDEYKPMFGLYLDIQKQLVLDEIDEKEVKGRWKRFVGKWNRGELAEGWYDPDTLRKAQISTANDSRLSIPTRTASDKGSEDGDGDGYGPALPSNPDRRIERVRNLKQSGPTIPNIQDLELQKGRLFLDCTMGATLTVITTELDTEESFRDREALHLARRSDRHLQREQLEELAPRATAETKDRQLERKADLRLANNAFAASKTDTSLADVPETDLMGDDDAGLAGYKKRKGEEERKRNEREIRRDEILRARRAEREERIQAYKEKEERTMEGLVALAKARFG
ncbi:MAG: hypothetical protein Q9213_006858 [Squamulea squamosa]